VGADTQEEVDANLARAMRWYRWACDSHHDCTFVMNWYVDILAYPGADAGPHRNQNEDRLRGLNRDDAVIRACDEYWMVVRASTGVSRGRHTATLAGNAVADLTHLGPEPPDFPFTVGSPSERRSAVVGECS
jgi:hypothetical protein